MYKVDKEKWNKFPADIQLKNIATELSRATQATLHNDEEKRSGAYLRAISLIDASIEDPKWQDRKMLYRLRDSISALYIGNADPAISNFICQQLLIL
jgi:hypothetical protein